MEVMEYGDDVLYQKAKDVDEITDDIKELVKKMFKTCYDYSGVGLAAPQVGKSIRMFILSIPPEDDSDTEDRKKYEEEVFINPVILTKKGSVTAEEGCLSVPGVYEKVKRAKFVTVEYTNLDGERKTIEATGLMARAIQHENDHLDGVLFIDRLPPLKQEVTKKKLNKEYGINF
ncbi:MAG: peptide deformylase [Candidatus Delongbacteria bacterium]|nr:peptide deformylase [Candidatus Delongbacteria bacterium]MBN2836213.1 peptide deformylase [Candidatus Delongbacteria bacterium]